MSSNWAKDIEDMQYKYKTKAWMFNNKHAPEALQAYLEFRIDFLQEELNETKSGVAFGDAEEVVDGLIDLCVVAIGTLDAFGVDANKAWDEVLKANLAKEVGIKPERPNPLKLPDLIKPEGWVGPVHEEWTTRPSTNSKELSIDLPTPINTLQSLKHLLSVLLHICLIQLVLTIMWLLGAVLLLLMSMTISVI